jgi:hypothetical protein
MVLESILAETGRDDKGNLGKRGRSGARTVNCQQRWRAEIVDPIATYKCEVTGWRWIFDLYPDRLTSVGTEGTERQFLQMELRHSSDIPDQSVRVIEVVHPAYNKILAGALCVAVLAFVGAVAVMLALDVAFAQGGTGPGFLGAWAFGVFLVCGSFLPAFLKKKMKQRFATFKSVSDGIPLLTLHSAFDPTDDSFEQFVDEVIAAIRKHREADPQFAQSIKP